MVKRNSALFVCICFILSCLPLSSLAADKVVVVPLFSGKPLKNIVTVALGNGDFTDPVAAVNSITDATEDNPYLVVIGPGVYDLGSEQLVMKDYVSITGSGRKATILVGKIGAASRADSALVVGAHGTFLTDLAVKNRNASGYFSTGIYADSETDFRIENVDIDLWGDSSTKKYGIRLENASTPYINNVWLRVKGSEYNYGIFNAHSSPRVNNTVVIAESGGANNRGFYNSYSEPLITNTRIDVSGGSVSNIALYDTHSSSTLRNVYAAASGGQNCDGIESNVSSTLIANVIVRASNGSVRTRGASVFGTNESRLFNVDVLATGSSGTVYGMFISNTSSPTVEHSALEGQHTGGGIDYGVRFGHADTRIMNTRIDGGVENNPAGTQCHGNYNSNPAPVGC